MSTPATTLAALRDEPKPSRQVVTAGFFDAAGFELMQRVARAFASSTLVPEAYRNNVANCMIALNLARRLQADELMVMQNLYIVHGNPGWSSKFLIASVNTCGRFSSLRYEWRGKPGADDFGCRAWAIERSTNERLDGVWVDWKMVRAEGWDQKKGSKWKTMPEQMFVYRAAAFWQRAYAPEISMGLSTAEELFDVVDLHDDGSYTVTVDSMRPGSRTVEPQGEGEGAATAPPSAGDEPATEGLSFAQLEASIRSAKSAQELDDLAAFFDGLPADQVADLERELEARRAELDKGAA